MANEEMLRLSEEVLRLSRVELSVRWQFLSRALFLLKDAPDDAFFGTEGEHFWYIPRQTLLIYKQNPALLSRQIMHVMMHCVFRHMFVSPRIDRRKWNMACDMAVEGMILEMCPSALALPEDLEKRRILADFQKHNAPLTAEHIYAKLQSFYPQFLCDDHSRWYPNASGGSGAPNQDGHADEGLDMSAAPDGSGTQNQDGGDEADLLDTLFSEKQRDEIQKRWEKVSLEMQSDMENFGKAKGDLPGGMVQALRELHRERYDYRKFLRRFATRREVMKTSDEEFDYISYTYGLRLYGNMPLIEPLEYRDDKRIRDLAIVIDTSGSTSGQLVQMFVQKTWNIIKQEETFARRFNIHFIQCDAEVQEDVVITSQREFDEYIRTLTLKGQGGTDFRPAFAYVERLMNEGRFHKLKGLLYFTDGYGDFPPRKPPFDAAFVFVKEEREPPETPPWAIRLVLNWEEIQDI